MEKKEFNKPEIVVINFDCEEIITGSTGGADYGAENGDEWNPTVFPTEDK